MAPDKEKTFMDYLKKVAPGTPLRTVIDDIIGSNLGGLIVFDNPEMHDKNMFEGGFRINCRFTPQKLFELCKMDGAIIISHDLKRILYSNVLLTPDTTLNTNETGTRHKAGERTAKQANTFVIAVSERRNKTTLYLGNNRYYLRPSEELLRDLSANLQVLEKQRELFNEQISDLGILEVTGMVSVSDVIKVLQRAEMMLKISDSVKRSFTELGKEGNVLNIRYRELLKGVEKKENDIIRDYAKGSLKRTKTLLSNLSYDGLFEVESVARLIMESPPEESVKPKGYRFLSHINLNEKEISQVVKQLKDLDKILEAKEEQLEPLLKNRATQMKEEINNIREQILSGKIII